MVLPSFADIAPETVIDNIGGTSETWLFVPRSYITTLQGTNDLDDATVTTMNQYSEIVDDHVFASGKTPFEIYCTMDKGTGKFSPQGERDGRSAKGEFSLFVPNINATTLGQMRKMKNERWIVFPVLADGTIIQLGSSRFTCDVTFEFDLGTNSSGLRGTKITVSCMESAGPYIYSGVLPS